MLKVKYKDKLFLDLLRCGVPKWVLQKCNGFELDKRLDRIVFESTTSNKKLKISPANQIKLFNDKLTNDDFQDNWLYCISGKSDPDVARCCAVMLMDRYITLRNMSERTGKDTELYKRKPLWHKINGSFNDALRDSKEYREKVGIPSLLILDCYYLEGGVNATNKIRDLVDMYGDIPRIIVGAGSDPVDICRNYLYVRPNCVLYIADSCDIDLEVV